MEKWALLELQFENTWGRYAKETAQPFRRICRNSFCSCFSSDTRGIIFSSSMIPAVQMKLPGTTVVLEWRRGEGDEEIEKSEPLEPVAAAGWFNPDRGLLLEPKTFMQTAKSFREAMRLAADKTLDYALLVYRSIHKVSSGQFSARYFGGPISIVAGALQMAKEGPAIFLLFLTLISANLAVINFLPIPVLDGGHIVFLAWEGIRGKPADKRVQLVLTYCGLLLILALMVWVLGLDLHLIARPGR